MTSKRGTVYNKTFNDEEWNKVSKFNKRALNDYLKELRQKKRKKSTIDQYNNDLRIFLIYVLRECDNLDVTELRRPQLRDYSLTMSDDLGLSVSRVNRLLSSMRSFLAHLEDVDDYDYDVNVGKKIKGLEKEAVKTNEDDFFLSYEQVMKLRKYLLDNNKLQDAVLLMLSFDSGARRNEVYQVKKSDLTIGNKTNKVIGKRGKEFRLVYLNDTKELIEQYLEQRGEDDIDSLWITYGKSKKPVKSGALYDRVVNMSKILSAMEGREIKFFPHSFRHSRAECLLQGHDLRILDENGNPKKFTLEQVQKLLNHSDPKTTQSYAKDHSEDEIDEMFGF